MLRAILSGLFVLSLYACSDSETDTSMSANVAAGDPSTSAAGLAPTNPFTNTSPLQFNYPPFDRIETSHFLPAFESGMTLQLAEIEAIAVQSAYPDFANTILALERSGQLLNRVSAVFDNLVAVKADNALLTLQQRLFPRLTSHDYQIVHNPLLFQRIATLYQQRHELELDAESLFLLERYYTDFVRAGAALTASEQALLVEIEIELEYLQTLYSENTIRQGAALASQLWLEEYGHRTLENSSTQQTLAEVDDRELRHQIHLASISRGFSPGEFDNRELLQQILLLRAQKAQLLGYVNYAEYALAVQSAGTLDTLDKVLDELSTVARSALQREAEVLQAAITESGEQFELAAWDWKYYQDRLQQPDSEDAVSEEAEGGNDSGVLFPANQALEAGVFFAAEQLYGVRFQQRFDLPVYHEDVQVFEVIDAVGSSLALLLVDSYSRTGKRSGAWSNVYVAQSGLLREQPVVGVQFNFAKPDDDAVALLNFDEVRIMFHEFGHALHAIFSNVEFPYFSGNRVAEDFVEFPGLLNEMFAVSPVVLENYAWHYETGEPLSSQQMLDLVAGRSANNGFAMTEYLAAAALDLALHRLEPDYVPTAEQLESFEQQALAQLGLDLGLVPPRYRSTYFLHLMGGFAAGYYSYLWADMLEADARQWFRDNGGLTRKNGDYFRQTILSRGGSTDAMVLFSQFTGHPISIQALVEQRGLN